MVRTVRDVPDRPKDGTVPSVILGGFMVVVVAATDSGHSGAFDVYDPSNLQIQCSHNRIVVCTHALVTIACDAIVIGRRQP